MFASSRLDKGGGQFRPVAKPRNPRVAATPAPVDSTEAGPSTDMQPTSQNSLSDSAPVQPPSSSQTFVHPSSTGWNSSGWEDEFSVDDRDVGYHHPPPEPSTSHPVPAAGSIVPTRGTSIVPTRGVSVVPSRGTSIVPTRGTSIVPTRGTSIVPTRGASIVPTRGASIVPTRGTSIVPSRTPAPSAPVIQPVQGETSLQTAPSSTEPTLPLRPPSLANTTDNAAEDGHEPASASAKSKGKGKAVVRPKPVTTKSKSAKQRKRTPVVAEDQDPTTTLEGDTGGGEDGAGPSLRRSSRKRPAADYEGAEDALDGLSSDAGSTDEYHHSDEAQAADGPSKVRKAPKAAKKTRAKRTRKAVADGEDDPAEEAAPRQRKRRKRSGLDLVPASEIPVDEDGEPMVLDLGAVTMGELCMDMGVGRPSSRTEEALESAIEWQKKQKIVRLNTRLRQKARFAPPAPVPAEETNSSSAPDHTAREGAEDAAEGEQADGEQDNDLTNISAATRRLQAAESSTDLVEQAQAEQQQASERDIAAMRTNKQSAQVRVDENGDVVMDDLSLTVDRYAAARAEDPVEAYDLVEEAERDRFVNSMTWTKKISGARWSKEETAFFYEKMQQWGTDFGMIAHQMPFRTRAEVRNKYNSEMKKDPARVEMAFINKKPMDLEEFSKATGLDLSGPAPEFPNLARTANTAVTENDDHLEHIDINVVPDRDSASPRPANELDGEIGERTGASSRGTASGDESMRASPTSATSSAIHSGKKGKGSKQKPKSKKGKKRGVNLADDEEIIGTVPVN